MLEVEVLKTSTGRSVRVTLGASLALVVAVLASHIAGPVGVELVKTLLALVR
jgi:hypothetical protein